MFSRYLIQNRSVIRHVSQFINRPVSSCSTHRGSILFIRKFSTSRTLPYPRKRHDAMITSNGLLTRRTPNSFSVAPLFSGTSKPATYNSETGNLIYVGSLSKMVKLVKVFSLSTSIIGLAMQPIIYNSISKLPVALAVVMGSFLGLFIFMTPLLLHLVTKRYVTAIYFKKETRQFTALSYTFFVNSRETKFVAEDVDAFHTPRPFSTLTVSGKPMFIDPDMFTDREAGKHLLGYDKPIDWSIPAKDLKHGSQQEKS